MEAVPFAFVALFLLLFLGLPIGLGLGLVGVLGFAWLTDISPALFVVGQVAADTALNYSFTVLPLFVLMGNLIAHARLAEELYAAAYTFLGHLRGGLAMATIIASGGFSAVSGSSLACAATMTRVAVPAMRDYGYSPSFAGGTVAAGGTLGILIPPSIAMVIYAIITEENLGALFIAGIVPGLMTVLLYIGAIAVTTALWPELGPPGSRSTWAQRLRALSKVWAILALFLLVLGGIYGGVFTPTEAAGIGAFGAFVFALVRGTLTWTILLNVLMQSARTSAMLFLVLVGALIFGNFVTIAGLPNALEQWLSGLAIGPIGILALIALLYLILGCLLESTAMMLLTVPVLYPVIQAQGIDPIWFGIYVVILVEMGLITPPIGMNVFVVKSMIPDVSAVRIYKGVLPFLAVELIRIPVIIAFPGIVLFLPSLM